MTDPTQTQSKTDTNLIMSTSGIRGIVGSSLTPELAMRCAQAFGLYANKGKIIVGGDTRTSHESFKHAVISGLLSIGVDVIYIGKVPTPTVQQAIRHHKANGGIVITASHNPIEWNGLKLMSDQGSFLTQAEYDKFKQQFDSKNNFLSDYATQGTLTHTVSTINQHIDTILSVINPESIQNSNFKVLVDPNHGTGGIATPLLLDRLNVDYDMIYETPDGKFSHTPEPLEKNLSTLINTMKEGGYDIGFAQDPDADRLVIVDEKGRFIGEDYSLGFCIDYVLQHEKETMPVIVVNLSTSQLIEHIGRQYNAKTIYTKIGEVNVTQGLLAHNAVVGGEGNGGVIYPKIGLGRDSLTGITLALSYLAQSKKTVSEIVNTYPNFYIVRDKITWLSQDKSSLAPLVAKLNDAFPNSQSNTEDGIKITMESEWVQMRPSNTEPIIRIFAEAQSPERAQALINTAKKAIEPLL